MVHSKSDRLSRIFQSLQFSRNLKLLRLVFKSMLGTRSMICQIWLDDSVTPPNESRFTIECYDHMSFFVIFRFYVGLVYISIKYGAFEKWPRYTCNANRSFHNGLSKSFYWAIKWCISTIEEQEEESQWLKSNS